MDLQYDSNEIGFREEVRSFISEKLPEDIARRQRLGFHVSRDMQQRWLKIRDRQGWAVPGWSVKFGGTGWTSVQQHIFEVESALADAPDVFVQGINLVGPVIQEFASPDMQEKYLPAIRSGQLAFAQGFSEPQAGSDLANLQTTADLVGDHFVVNGSKIWISGAHESDAIFCLVRTDRSAPKPQMGISMLLIPLDAPGVTIRPIITVDGCHHLNEVFFQDVVVPIENLVGKINKGWDYTKFLLDNEKTYNAHIGLLKRFIIYTRELIEAAVPRSFTADFLTRLARLTIDVEALEWAVLRALRDAELGGGLNSVAPALKIRGSELLLRFSEMQMEALGPDVVPSFSKHDMSDGDLHASAWPAAPGLMPRLIYWRASSVFGGSNDIQRTVIWNNALRP